MRFIDVQTLEGMFSRTSHPFILLSSFNHRPRNESPCLLFMIAIMLNRAGRSASIGMRQCDLREVVADFVVPGSFMVRRKVKMTPKDIHISVLG